MEELNDIFKAFWETKDEEYYSMNPEYIIFTYKIIDPLNKDETIKIKFNKIKSSEKEENVKILGNNLPYTLEFNKR